MALIVEDGTGKSDAEAFASVAYADTYHAARSTAATWTARTTAEKEQDLREATDYLEAMYRNRWPGDRRTKDQSLAWPRANAYDTDDYLVASDSVPTEVQDATAEAAGVLAGGESLLVDEARKDRAIREKVGPIEREFAAGSSSVKRYRKVEGHLRSFIPGLAGPSLRMALA